MHSPGRSVTCEVCLFAEAGPPGTRAHLARALWSVLLLIVLLGPMLAIGMELLHWASATPERADAPILGLRRHLGLLLKSLAFSGSVAAMVVTISIGAASVFWTWHCRATRALLVVLLSTIALPPYLHGLGWQAVAAAALPDGYVASPFGGWVAAWWVQSMALIPAGTGLTLLGFLVVAPELFDAGRIMRPDMQSFRHVVLPLARAPILVVCAFAFLFTLTDYSVASAFQRNTYAFDIFAEFSASHSAARAAVVSLPLLVVSGGVLLALPRLLFHVSLRGVLRPARWSARPRWPLAMSLAQTAALGLLALQISVPVLGSALLLDDETTFGPALASAWPDIVTSLRTAGLAALLAVPLAYAAATRILRRGGAWMILILLPIGVPAPLLGIGIVELWNHDATAAIYDSELLLVLTYLARFLPLATLIMAAQLARIDRASVEAAHLLMQNPVRAWVQVFVPMLARSATIAAFLVFALSLGELSASLLALPPGASTITARIYGYMHYGASGRVAWLCLAVPILSLMFAVLLMTIDRCARLLLPNVPELEP